MQGLITKTALFSSALLASALLLASSACATPPSRLSYEFTASGTLTGLAEFDIQVDSVCQNTETQYFDKSGALTRIYIHIVEQDTFTALVENGKTLMNEPYAFSVQMDFDEDGNITNWFTEGNQGKVPLPNGKLFKSAGRTDWMNHPGVGFVLWPDKGACVNLDGFIEALSPEE